MKIFGLSITREKAMSSVSDNRGGWWPLVMEPFGGAWQRNISLDRGQVISNPTVFACVTLICGDFSKLRLMLVEEDDDGIWSETTNPAYSPVLRKPNHFQTRIQFLENWMMSKLLRGNAYILKQRDNRGVVVALYVLDPARVKPLVSDDGAIFYEINPDNLAAQDTQIIVPAREIIHDRFNCLFHPLVGVSPIYAAGLAATQGLHIQNNSAWFFSNKAMPGAVLTAPGQINPDTAARLKEAWDANYSGANAGKVAVLGDGLKFEKLPISSADAQMIEQLKWTDERICTAFHVPPHKVGVGPQPTYNNVEALDLQYYAQCLQVLIESAEVCLDEGLEFKGTGIGTEFDLAGLLRMDTVAQINALKEAVGAGIMTPNEARAKLDLKPVKGGESPYLQQQNYSLAALDKRDAQDDPFATNTPAPALPAPDDPDDEEPDDEEIERTFLASMTKHWDSAISEVPAYGR